ncbi:MAG: phosphoenolpyruvate carboxylase [Cryomorphaceae bacterium]
MNESKKAFEELVSLKYQVFNSIFLTLNLDGVHKTGILLPLLKEHCEDGFMENQTPKEIIDSFFEEHQDFKTDKSIIDQLFRFIQYIERQVVLVDSLEDAAYGEVNSLEGAGSFKAFYEEVINKNKEENLLEALRNFRTRLVLTAHPTQFYPGAVLGIITDLAEAIKRNDLTQIKQLLAQLGKTPFFKKEKPSPFDEAVSLTWYLENIFYESIPAIYRSVYDKIGERAAEIFKKNALIQLGFWPGGDRDGNPFVSAQTTTDVANRLRTSIMKCYYRDIRILKRKITFRHSADILTEIERKLYLASFVRPDDPPMKAGWVQNRLDELRESVEEHHNGLYLEDLDKLRDKFKIFGFHFGSIDLRQDSRVIKSAFESVEALKGLSQNDDFEGLLATEEAKGIPKIEEPVLKDVFESMALMQDIQKNNGSLGCYRYIISNCRNELDVARVFAIAKYTGLGKQMYIDIIPLFETIDDLERAAGVMEKLYENTTYSKHLTGRKKKQVVMLGFSDGTKDGGYITANWSIFKAKERITEVSRKFGIRVVFFDGRGGPPARGGGNTHKFYASLGPGIESSQIQITIQGQTISSNFGTYQSSRFNLEQLLTAGLHNTVFQDDDKILTKEERNLLEELSEHSYKTYQDFKSHPRFVPYLEEMSTLKYYGETNIGSRPSKRGKSSKLKFEDLRAIPFVGAWSQLKQNVPGFYGFGTAMEMMDKKGKLNDVKNLYKHSLFFRTLVENSMQSLSKSYFDLTKYMSKDPEYGAFWKMIYEESVRARDYLLKVSGQQQLLETNPSIKMSISLRENIVLPLLTIQQYALIRIKELEKAGKGKSALADTLRKLVVRSLYGNINASRNSA